MHTPYETCFRLSLVNLSHYKMRTLMEKSFSTILHLVLFTSAEIEVSRATTISNKWSSLLLSLSSTCYYLAGVVLALHVRPLWQYPFVSCACSWLPPLMFPSMHTPTIVMPSSRSIIWLTCKLLVGLNSYSILDFVWRTCCSHPIPNHLPSLLRSSNISVPFACWLFLVRYIRWWRRNEI